ncbi:glycosyltransferase [Pseudofrankia sp. DC12]|uniref:glycosyltransferase n=1 Tax=Pseudofrankia sp. DC12 TaxID=683315 RepID=UPI0005F7A744|nr:glycosyltransferase [Pseudofrankia sp. DC12]
MPLGYGFLSTYPPTQCGLATFTAALREHLTTLVPGAPSGVVRLLDAPAGTGAGLAPAGPAEVIGDLVAGTSGGPAHAARLLNRFDVVLVQHEYGVYGGRDGAEVVDVLRRLEVPAVVVLHTVLTRPTPHQRQILEAVAAAAAAIVVMTETARDRLAAGYRVDQRRVSVIPHGAAGDHRPASARAAAPVPTPARARQPTILTWGLIGPGKGIEWGIAALAALADLGPSPRYVVAGETHPKVLAREGEAYRDGLVAQARRLGLAGSVVFDARYRDAAALAELVRSADLVLLPYDSLDQVTSGVLIEAVAAHKPIVATRFPHAVELLGDGTGLLVAHRDPTAIAAAVRAVVTDDGLRHRLAHSVAARAPELLWPAVARRYQRLAVELVARTEPAPSVGRAVRRSGRTTEPAAGGPALANR